MNKISRKQLFSGLSAIWLAHLAVDFMLGIFPAYKSLANLDLSKIGLIFGAAIFIGEGMQLLFGFLGDKGYQKVFTALGVLMAGSICLLPHTASYSIMFLIILATYLGSGSFHPSAAGMVSGWSERKGLIITLFAMGGTFGAAMSQVIFTSAYQYLKGNTAILMIPVFLLALAILFFPFPEGRKKESLRLNQILDKLKKAKKELFLLYSIQVLIQMVLLSLMFLLPDILRIHYFPEWYSLGGGNFFFVFGAASMCLISGYFSDTVGHRQTLRILVGVSCVLFYTFLWQKGTGMVPMSIILFLLGGFLGSIGPVIVAAGQKVSPSEAHSLISGSLFGGAACIGGTGLFISSALMKFYHFEAPINTMWLMGALFFLAFALLSFLKNKSFAHQTQEGDRAPS